MFALLILAIGFYLYKTGDLQKFFGKTAPLDSEDSQSARRIIDLRYAAGKMSEEEYIQLKNII